VTRFIRLVRLIGPFRWQMALAVALGAATVGGGVGLMGAAAYLIATAALHPSIAELQVAIVGVRFFGLSRGVFRYLERLISHDLTLRLLGRFRLWFFRALEPLAPAKTLELKSADLLTRAVSDVESLQELYLRALAPPLVAVVVGVSAAAVIGLQATEPALVFAAAYTAASVLVPTGDAPGTADRDHAGIDERGARGGRDRRGAGDGGSAGSRRWWRHEGTGRGAVTAGRDDQGESRPA